MTVHIDNSKLLIWDTCPAQAVMDWGYIFMRKIFEDFMEEFGLIDTTATYRKPFGKLDDSDYSRIEAELIRFADNLAIAG